MKSGEIMSQRTITMRPRWLSALLAGLILSQTAMAAPTDLQIVMPKQSVTLTLAGMKAKLQTHLVEIDDPVYKSRKSYDGFLLTDVFDLAGFAAGQSADECIFATKDGYSPNVSFDAVKEHVAYLVFQEHGKREEFEPVQQGKTQLSPGPYYLVWKEGAKIGQEIPWPYQLVKIELTRFAEKYPLLYPSGAATDSMERKGFLVFKSECIRCHSINLQGGEVGPELNAPQNVTEYWRPEVLQAFIKNAPSFRFKSKMPPFTQLSDAQVASVIAYFRYMAQHKISKPND